MKRLIVTRSSAIERKECVQMPVKIARSAARPSFGLPELLVAIHTSRQSCRKAGKAPIFTLVDQDRHGDHAVVLACPIATLSLSAGLTA
jgi:hypothetical protein